MGRLTLVSVLVFPDVSVFTFIEADFVDADLVGAAVGDADLVGAAVVDADFVVAAFVCAAFFFFSWSERTTSLMVVSSFDEKVIAETVLGAMLFFLAPFSDFVHVSLSSTIDFGSTTGTSGTITVGPV